MKKREQKRKNKLSSPAVRIRLSKREAAPFLSSRPLRVTLFSVLVLFLLAALGLSVFLTNAFRFLLTIPLLQKPFSTVPVSVLSIAASELFTFLFLLPLLLGLHGYLYAVAHGEAAPERLLFAFYTDKDLRLFSLVLYLRVMLSAALFSVSLCFASRFAVVAADGLSIARATLLLFLAIVGCVVLVSIFLADMLSLFPAVGEAVRERKNSFRRIFRRAGRRMKSNRLVLLRLYLSYAPRFLLILLSGGVLLPFLLPRVLVAASLLETSFQDSETAQTVQESAENVNCN